VYSTLSYLCDTDKHILKITNVIYSNQSVCRWKVMMEVDDSVCDVSVRVFYGRKAALHNISLTSTTQSVNDLKTAICNTLEILADRHIIGMLTI